MRMLRIGSWMAALVLPCLGAALVLAADGDGKTTGKLGLETRQKDHLWQEPILVRVDLRDKRFKGLPATVGKNKGVTLRFDISPTVKARTGAKPLPLEGAVADATVATRRYDLCEWFTFPAAGGTWTVKAVVEHGDATLTSPLITVTVRRPEKGSAEVQPVDRIHHLPWSNYDTNAFCGDTFDLVARWPTSKLARYCHYWNGRHMQFKKQYDKAIASYKTVLEKHPDFELAGDAEFGIVECLVAQKKFAEASKANTALRNRIRAGSAKSGRPSYTGTVVERLAEEMTTRINRDLAAAK